MILPEKRLQEIAQELEDQIAKNLIRERELAIQWICNNYYVVTKDNDILIRESVSDLIREYEEWRAK